MIAKNMMADQTKVLVALFVTGAIVFIAIAVADAYSSIPRQFGDKVCVKIMKELKCEPISAE